MRHKKQKTYEIEKMIPLHFYFAFLLSAFQNFRIASRKVITILLTLAFLLTQSIIPSSLNVIALDDSNRAQIIYVDSQLADAQCSPFYSVSERKLSGSEIGCGDIAEALNFVRMKPANSSLILLRDGKYSIEESLLILESNLTLGKYEKDEGKVVLTYEPPTKTTKEDFQAAIKISGAQTTVRDINLVNGGISIENEAKNTLIQNVGAVGGESGFIVKIGATGTRIVNSYSAHHTGSGFAIYGPAILKNVAAYSNGESGIIWGAAEGSVYRSSVTKNQYGITVEPQSYGSFTHAAVWGNGLEVLVKENAKLYFTNSIIGFHESNQPAVKILKEGAVLFEGPNFIYTPFDAVIQAGDQEISAFDINQHIVSSKLILKLSKETQAIDPEIRSLEPSEDEFPPKLYELLPSSPAIDQAVPLAQVTGLQDVDQSVISLSNNPKLFFDKGDSLVLGEGEIKSIQEINSDQTVRLDESILGFVGSSVYSSSDGVLPDNDLGAAESGNGGAPRAECVIESASCDDGNPCTENDICVLGVCVGYRVSCQLGYACNRQTGQCQISGLGCAHVCLSSTNNPCIRDTCFGNQACYPYIGPPGAPCSDREVCNGDELCDLVGHCLPGAPPSCDDGNICTTDSCQFGGVGCRNVPITPCIINEPPVIEVINGVDVINQDSNIPVIVRAREGTPLTFGVRARDPNVTDQQVTQQMQGMPAGAGFNVSISGNPSTYILSWATPIAGTYDLVVEASDGRLTDSQRIRIECDQCDYDYQCVDPNPMDCVRTFCKLPEHLCSYEAEPITKECDDGIPNQICQAPDHCSGLNDYRCLPGGSIPGCCTSDTQCPDNPQTPCKDSYCDTQI
ncbi:MAG: hypothetical protein HY582_05085, partial [Candidatus Omnitrophica bacterium]|nr:hypothetical protein [Candidatus Omnitrophota bacterium]